MRGCLGVLVLAALFAVVGLWFGGPVLAGTVVEATLTGSGLQADELDVEVRADPPLRTALGQADRVVITASGLRWNGIRAGSMSLTLGRVDLLARTAETVEGTFGGIELSAVEGPPATVGMRFSGPTAAAATVVTVDAATIDRLAGDAFEREVGSRPDGTSVEAPGRLRIVVAGQTLDGELRIDDAGALVVDTILGTVTVAAADPAIPLRLTGVSAVEGRLELSGTLDLAALLR